MEGKLKTREKEIQTENSKDKDMAIGDYAFLSKTFLLKDMFLKIFPSKIFLENSFSKNFICSGNLKL